MIGTSTKCEMEMAMAENESILTCGTYAIVECTDCQKPLCDRHLVTCPTCGKPYCYVWCIEDHECHAQEVKVAA